MLLLCVGLVFGRRWPVDWTEMQHFLRTHRINKIKAFGGMVLKFVEIEKTLGFVLKPWVLSATLRILRVRRVKVYIYIYTYSSIYIYIHIYIYTHTYIYIYICSPLINHLFDWMTACYCLITGMQRPKKRYVPLLASAAGTDVSQTALDYAWQVPWQLGHW